MCEVTRDGSLAELLHAHLPERGPPSDANHRGIARVLTLSRLRSLGQKPNVRGAASCGSEAKVSASASRRRHRHTAFLIFRVLATFVLALLVIMQMPSTGPEPSAVGGTPGGLLVTFRADAAPPEIIATGAQILESYGSFAVARGGAGILSALRAAGHYAEPLQSPSDLELAGGPVDVAMLASRPPAPWSVDDRGMAVGIVHFRVPIKAEWKTDLESRGMDVLRYLPQDAFIVRGRPADLDGASSMPSVNWVGPYEAGWKVRPGTATQGLVDARIIVFPGAYPETVEAWLGHAGIPALSGSNRGPMIVGTFGSGDFQWVRARIPANLVASLADQPSVEFIDPVEAVHTWNAETDWVIQTNSSNLYRYWTNGLDGSGQVIGTSPNDGNALGAKIYLQDIGGFPDPLTAICPAFGGENLIYLPEDYTNLFGPPGLVYNDPIAPVRIHSDSWGADTNVYDVSARMVDAFVWSHPDMTILFAAADMHWAGTSYATPAAAAAAAIIRQYFTDGWYPSGAPVAANSISPSAALVRAILIASGQQVTGTGTVRRSLTDTWPNNEQGFGRVLLSKVLPIAAAGDTFRTQVVDGTAGLLTGDDATYTFHIATPGPVKFVLTWNDYPGTIGAAKALVNDLDLQVTAPNGAVYRGNHFAPFAQGQSLTDGTFDTTNVEEAVILKTAIAGDWSVRVIASNVAVGPQPFALVATGNIDGSYGRVLLDRPAYSESDTVRLAVEDSGATSAVVQVASGIEPGGENVTLGGGIPGQVWRGSIRTAFGTPTPDGVLQVRDGDTITATYQDVSPSHLATAKAIILAGGPTIRDVNVDGIGATSAVVRWTTNKPATTEVLYGTNLASLTLGANASDLRTDHAISLTNLSPDTLYYFAVSSRGRLANATTDSNVGLGYRFQTASLGDVLLVVGGSSFPPEREASYAAALHGNGWTWSVWRVAELGLPNLSVLQGRRAVIWQVGLEQYPPFNASARALIQTYLDRGGRLVVSSHDTGWALGYPSSPFATPETQAWLHSVLKASFVCDPLTIGQVIGVTSDPISGSYTGGVGYTPHRDGGADDQLSPNPAGGTSVTDWAHGKVQSPPGGPSWAQSQPDGLRRGSSSPDGTAGQGVWGGTPSRLAYFAFEITGIDTTATNLNPTSSTRAAILDSALRWLGGTSTTGLDRDHPDVNITSPSGGIFTGVSIPITWTAAAYGAGVAIANFTLASSRDGGSTWNPIAAVPGSARSSTWNVSGVPNGEHYLVRITTQDDGTPALSGSDVTDAAFTIARPGGDSEGPVLWAGSVRVDPQPPGAALPATFIGTADDRARGSSPLIAAELFLQTAPPTPGDTGTGLPMEPADGTFDATVEGVVWQGALADPPGVACAWSHAEDAAENWGPYASICFLVISAGPDTAPPAIATPNAIRLANAAQDLVVGWPAAWDQGRYGGTTAYHILRATSPGGPYLDVSGAIPQNGSARYSFLDPGRAADASNYFYRIENVDAANNVANSTTLAVKVRIPFLAGLNLLGMPVALTNPVFGVTVQTLKATTGADQVLGFDSAGPYHVRALSDASVVQTGLGYWVHIAAAVTWTVPGW